MVLPHSFPDNGGKLDFDLQKDNDKKKSTARVIAITSGKGGVGKTNVATNLGIALAGLQKKVCIFDADMGLANINILIGKNPEFTIEDVLAGDIKIDQVLMDAPGGVKVAPASSALDKIVKLGPQKMAKLLSTFEEIERNFDYLLIDTPAGISSTVLSLVQSAQDAVVVVTPEPTSLTDAYSLIKVLNSRGFDGELSILVNMVLSYEDSLKIFLKLNAATKKYLFTEMKYLGYVINDPSLAASVVKQNPIMLLNPESISSRCFVSIARKLESMHTSNVTYGFGKYWREFLAKQKEADKNEIVSTPDEIKEKIFRINAVSLEEYANKISQTIKMGDYSEDEAREFILKIERSFSEKFDKLPYDIKTSLYSSLEFSNFDEKEICDLSQLLESIFEKRYKRSLHNVSDIFIKLLEESKISEEKMRIFLKLLENSFRRRFKKSIFNLKEMLKGELNREDFSKDKFSNLIESFKKIYLKRFGYSYSDPRQLPIEEVKKTFNLIEEQEREYNELFNKASNLLGKREKNLKQLVKLISKFSKHGQ